MKNITDDDLTLLYYGEQSDPTLAAQVAGSEELSARFDRLCAELERIDALAPPERGNDYAAEVWQKISPRLAAKCKNTSSITLSWPSATSYTFQKSSSDGT